MRPIAGGDHSAEGYLKTESDPTVPSHVKAITQTDIDKWNSGGGDYTGADSVKLTGDQSVAGHKTWTSVATFGDTVIMRGSINGDDTANFQNAVTAGSFIKSGGTSSQYLMADGSVSTGSPDSGGGGFSGDYNDLTNKPTIPTNNNQLVNGAGYITSSSLSGYATESWVSSNYQPKGSYLTSESDPTVPAHVKAITQTDINNWNNPPSGGGDDPNAVKLTGDQTINGVKTFAGGTTFFKNLFISGVSAGGVGISGAARVEFSSGAATVYGASNTLQVNSGGTAISGGITCTGPITGTDCIASSDERLKDNITHRPLKVPHRRA